MIQCRVVTRTSLLCPYSAVSLSFVREGLSLNVSQWKVVKYAAPDEVVTTRA